MDFDTEVKLAVYRYFAETGHRPSPQDVAELIAHTGTSFEFRRKGDAWTSCSPIRRRAIRAS